jgi:sulfur-oxidizing protein SoxY
MKQTITHRSVVVRAIAVAAVLLTVATAQAAPAAFQQTSVDGAIRALSQGQPVLVSKAISVKAPKIAESGALVGVRVVTGMKNVESISLLVQGNPYPLTSVYRLSASSVPLIKSRIRISSRPGVPRTADVIALVKAGGKWYRSSQKVKVTLGGCGG